MPKRDYTAVMEKLSEAYAKHSPRSAALNREAGKFMVDGGSHAVRLMEPFPPRIATARGGWMTDEDGHQILDFWQGHWANILGHNPAVITSALSQAFAEGFGLQTGFTDRLQIETAEILCRQTSHEQVRFTTSGSLATMYAIMLARAFTGRELVLKVGGGWHGAQLWGLKGVHFGAAGFEGLDSAGIPQSATDEVLITRYNDPDFLRDQFRRHGDGIACFILEPCMGAGGGMPATKAYLQAARELTHQHGSILIFDEIICGFRYRAGDVGSLVGVRPDLATFAKVIGGGMPIAAVAGRADILGIAGHAGGSRVGFSGGTFSAHPACMLAAKVMMSHLVEHEAEIYPKLADLGDKARRMVEKSFAEEGIYAQSSGYGNDALPPSSLVRVHFPYSAGHPITRPEDALNPAVCDVELSDKVLRVAMLLENVNVMFGLGSISAAHTEADLALVAEAIHRTARRLKPAFAASRS